MSDIYRRPVDLPAPTGAIGWTPSAGFIFGFEQLETALVTDPFVLEVDPSGHVPDVEGTAPLAVAVRQDAQISALQLVVREIGARLSAHLDRADVEDRR